MENSNLRDVKVPSGAKYKDEEVIKVLNPVIGETAKDTGYMVLLGNGEKQFVKQSDFEKLGATEADKEGEE